MFIHAANYSATYFNGEVWPGRFITFATGMIIMTSLTYIYLGETINLKTVLTLILSFIIVLLQILI